MFVKLLQKKMGMWKNKIKKKNGKIEKCTRVERKNRKLLSCNCKITKKDKKEKICMEN